jgi:hypothetical protein
LLFLHLSTLEVCFQFRISLLLLWTEFLGHQLTTSWRKLILSYCSADSYLLQSCKPKSKKTKMQLCFFHRVDKVTPTFPLRQLHIFGLQRCQANKDWRYKVEAEAPRCHGFTNISGLYNEVWLAFYKSCFSSPLKITIHSCFVTSVPGLEKKFYVNLGPQTIQLWSLFLVIVYILVIGSPFTFVYSLLITGDKQNWSLCFMVTTMFHWILFAFFQRAQRRWIITRYILNYIGVGDTSHLSFHALSIASECEETLIL